MKIFLADKDPLLRIGWRFFFNRVQDIIIVGEAGDSLSAIKQMQSSVPDVALIDEEMPDLTAVETVQILRKSIPEIIIIILSIWDYPILVHEVICAGADGFVIKSVNNDELLVIIRSLCKRIKLESPYLIGVSTEFTINHKPILKNQNPDTHMGIRDTLNKKMSLFLD